MSLNSPVFSDSCLALDFDELNQEVKINNERIYTLVQSLLEQKIEVDTAAPIISEFKARNEYLRQVIGDMYKNFSSNNQLLDRQQEEVTVSESATGHIRSKQTCPPEQDHTFESSSSTIAPPSNTQSKSDIRREDRRLRPKTRVIYTGMDGVVEKSRGKSTSKAAATLRRCKFKSLEKVTLNELRARGYTRLVSISDHIKLHDKIWIVVKLCGENQEEKSFALSCVDTFDADRNMLKNYFDSVEVRATNLTVEFKEQLEYIRNNHIDILCRDRLVEIESFEIQGNPPSPSVNQRDDVGYRTTQNRRLPGETRSVRNWRIKQFNSYKKITRQEAQAYGCTRLISVHDHLRLHGKTFMMITLQKENSTPTSDDEENFVMSLLEVYDFDKYILKKYVDSVTGIRGQNISSNIFKQLNLIRQNNIDELDRNDLVELETIELLKYKRRNAYKRDSGNTSTRIEQNNSEIICIDSDSDFTEVKNNISCDASSILTQAPQPLQTQLFIDQKPILSATPSFDAPSPLLPHLIIN